MKKLFLSSALVALLAITLSNNSQAQTTTTTTTTVTTTNTNNTLATSSAPTMFVELFGPGLLFSANFDSRFGKHRDGLGGRAGLGYFAADGLSMVTVPVQLNYLLGKNGKYFEIGAGVTYASVSDGVDNNDDSWFNLDGHGTIGTTTFGYRYQPLDGGFNFRASFNPLFNSESFIPFFGLSFGYTFK